MPEINAELSIKFTQISLGC